MVLDKIKAYKVEKKERIAELESDAYILRHIKTGARVALLENEDENKVFYIGFRTPPEDSTGVMHILEHSVLCGSEHFPVKDPFIELAKGSLNTFLNAMTYPDKTVYPVASCNDKDFQNLMHVYLDAVFYPNCMKSDETFRQEGWHYEMESPEDDLKINGVVYNEMKGAFSSPDDVFEREIFNSLFPDTEYSVESGGDPKDIPSLTYAHYKETYERYYHPSNSFIYLYGNMDMAEKLDFIDREYLGKFDKLEIDSQIKSQKPFDKTREINKEYSITESEPLKENTYLSYNVAMADNLDKDKYIAFQVIDYALGSCQGAVLKKALLEAGIGKDVYTFYDNGIKQPYFSVVAKNTDKEKKEEFLDIIKKSLEKVVKEGFDKDTLRAGLNGLEFRYREADFGSYPPGLMYGLQVLDSWLYDDDAPFIHIAADETYKKLRKAIDSDYYEQLVKEWILDNKHNSVVVVSPKVGLTEEEDERLAGELADYKASLSEEEIEKIVKDTADLRAYQEEEDDPEALKCIPVLSISDIDKKAFVPGHEVRDIDGKTCIYHNIHTNGIDYVRLIHKVNNIPARLFPSIGLLKAVWGMLNTKNYTYGQLFNQIFIRTGGMSSVINVYEDSRDDVSNTVTFEIKGKCLKGDLKNIFELAEEICLNSIYDDEKRLLEILSELKSRMQASALQSGHLLAKGRAASYHSTNAKLNEIISGVDFYRLVEETIADYDNRKAGLIADLKELASYVFMPSNLIYDFVGAEDEYKEFGSLCEDIAKKWYPDKDNKDIYKVELKKLNEGFCSASQVQFVSRAGNFKEKGYKYSGSLKALRIIMGYDYLWNNVRVKGGAYGCMSSFSRSGDSFFVSYRDPNLRATNEIFENVVDYIKNFDADDRSMTQYIIGAVSELDTPLTPSQRAIRELGIYMMHQDAAAYQKERDELLATTKEKIRELAPLVQAVLDDKCICVLGNVEKVKADKDLFNNVENLFKS